ncbi:MAG TPA: hypothetical protein VGH20_21350 [Myxococcales bacterium]|jgi:hypothetical protein
MPVTFGTVQLLPATAAANDGKPAPSKAASEPPEPRDLAPSIRQLHDRAARVRAH